MKFFYSTAIRLYLISINVAAFFNSKAKRWIVGRQDWRTILAAKIVPNQKYIWIHCASLGEFEQGRPLIEAIRIKYPNFKLLLTFFSPSGYEIRKNYESVDIVSYLPIDLASNAKDFIKITNPSIAIFIKYEFWLNYLAILKKNQIPTFLVAANFRPDQLFFKWYGSLFLKALKSYHTIYVQNNFSQQLLNSFGIHHVKVASDTRFDRVSAIATTAEIEIPIQLFFQQKPVFIVGSAWLKEVELLAALIQNTQALNWKWVIVPHEIDKDHLQPMLNLFQNKPILYSNLNALTDEEITKSPILVMDVIGKLASLYTKADLVLIGGGFNKGIHNILEPGVFGVPILIGPNYSKFQEAVDLLKLGGVHSISNYKELYEQFLNFQSIENRTKIGSINKAYIEKNKGGTNQIMNDLESVFLTIV